MTRTLPVIVCSVLLAGASWPQPAAPPRAGTHEIALDFRTHQPIAPVRLNGGRAVPFLFDTGASINAVDTGIAVDAGVVGRDARDMTGGGQGHVRATFADSLQLQVGVVTWSSQRAAILPLGYPDRKHFAGFIGAPILMRYVAQFDFPARVLRLFAPGSYRPSAGAVVVPFELQDDLPVVRAMVDAGSGPIEARLMLDTGAGDSAADLNRPFVDVHKLLDVVTGAAETARPAAIGGAAPFVYGTGRRIALGTLTFDNPRLGLSRATQGSSSRNERDGIIGNSLLERFVVTFDYQRRKVIFEPPR